MSQSDKTVYVVATPMGNLSDLTERAREVLAQVDIICAEHPQHTKKLMQTCGIVSDAKFKSCHQHNEKAVCQWLERGTWGSVALVSDAGTPNIHDPGQLLIERAWINGWRLVPVPGPSALTCALSICDVPTHPSLFVGFLPSQSADRKSVLRGLQHEKMLLVFYESPHRLQKSLTDMQNVLGDRMLWLCRELTKKYEQIVRASLAEIIERIDKDIPQKGEFVLLVSGAADIKRDDSWQQVAQDLAQHMPQREVIAFMQRHFNCRKNEVYNFLLNNEL